MVGDLEAILETGSVAAVELAASELAKQGKATGKCANCDNPIIGAYCAVCGQPTNVHRRSIVELVHDFVSELASFDSRILRTARALLFQPGELPLAFHEGRTQRYMPALRLYLFVSLIFFVLLGATGIALVQLEVVPTPVKVTRDANGNYFIPNAAYDKNDPDTHFLGQWIRISRMRAEEPGGLFTFTTRTYFFRPLGSVHTHLTAAQRKQLAEPPPGVEANIAAAVAHDPSSAADLRDAQRQLEAADDAANKLDGEAKVVAQSQLAAARARLAAAKPSGKNQALATATAIKSGIMSGIQRIAADPAALNGPITTWLPRALFFLLPLYALLLALAHIRRRKQYYFVDHLVFSLTIHTFVFAALIVAAGLAQVLPSEIVAWALLAVISLYIFIAMKRFYRQGWVRTSIKFVVVSGVYTILFLVPALAIVTSLGFFGGKLG